VMNAVHDAHAALTGSQVTVVPHELTVHIHSPDVPTMEIVDLPGIRETPPEMAAATRSLAVQYAQRPTDVVLCVVPATQTRLVSSQSVGIAQQLERFDRTVCVLTKCDEVNVARNTQLQVLMARLRNGAAECGMKNIIGVINRDVQEEEFEQTTGGGGGGGEDASVTSELARMRASLSTEQEWFAKWAPDLDPEQQVSIRALIRSLDRTMHEHIVQTWIPSARALLTEQRAKHEATLRALGGDVAQMPAEAFEAEFERMVAQVVAQTEAAVNNSILKPMTTQMMTRQEAEYLYTFAAIRTQFVIRSLAQYQEECLASAREVMATVLELFKGALWRQFPAPVAPSSVLENLKAHLEKVKVTKMLDWLFGRRGDMPTGDEVPAAEASFAFNWGRFTPLRDALAAHLAASAEKGWADTVATQVRAYAAARAANNPGVNLAAKRFAKETEHGVACIVLGQLFGPLLEMDTYRRFLRELQAGDREALLQEHTDFREERARLLRLVESIDDSLLKLAAVESDMDGGDRCRRAFLSSR